MANDLVVYGVQGSPFVRKVMIALDEKRRGFDLETVVPMSPPDWYAEINPLKRVPAFRDRTLGTEGKAGTLADSSVICAYLERRFPEPALYPADPYAYARALWFEEYADTEVASVIGGGMFFPAVVKPLIGQEPDLDTARTTLTEKCPPLFDYLNDEVKGSSFAVGGAFSVADIALAVQIINLRLAGGTIDAARWPELAAYADFILSRPAIAARHAEEAKAFPPVDLGL